MDWILLVAMAALLGFMFWSSRRRAARLKTEQEAKAQAMVPGVKVLLQGGLYGILVSYDPEDLSKSAEVELAPGAVVEVHSQAILRVVDETEEVADDEFAEADAEQSGDEALVADDLVPPAERLPVTDASDIRPVTDARDTPKA